MQFSGPHGERISAAPVVSTHRGKVQGLTVDGVHRYLGMRYAKPPVGGRRFKPPVAHDAWDGIAEAVHYGPPAMQGVPRDLLFPKNDFEVSQTLHAPYAGLTKIQNEDCLYLNVWTDDTDDAKPVIVWFHGGGFAYGSGSEPVYDGARLARRRGVVVVTLNHRLNLFGYINLVGTHPYYDDAVNLGALDLVKALEWVQENIAAFGGDPANVTISGESGGAAKVGDMLAMPGASGLFHKAIAMSGARPTAVEFDHAATDSLAILRQAGVSRVDPERIAQVPAQVLLDAGLSAFTNPGGENVRHRAVDEMGDIAVRLGTTVDGKVLPRHPFSPDAPPISAGIPLLIGWTKDEWTLMLVERDPAFIDMTEEDLQCEATELYGSAATGILETLRGQFPGYAPGHLAAQLIGSTISKDMRLDHLQGHDGHRRPESSATCARMGLPAVLGDARARRHLPIDSLSGSSADVRYRRSSPVLCRAW